MTAKQFSAFYLIAFVITCCHLCGCGGSAASKGVAPTDDGGSQDALMGDSSMGDSSMEGSGHDALNPVQDAGARLDARVTGHDASSEVSLQDAGVDALDYDANPANYPDGAFGQKQWPGDAGLVLVGDAGNLCLPVGHVVPLGTVSYDAGPCQGNSQLDIPDTCTHFVQYDCVNDQPDSGLLWACKAAIPGCPSQEESWDPMNSYPVPLTVFCCPVATQP